MPSDFTKEVDRMIMHVSGTIKNKAPTDFADAPDAQWIIDNSTIFGLPITV
jgi:hypothetical protein